MSLPTKQFCFAMDSNESSASSSTMKAKCARIQEVLDELFPDPPIPLNYNDTFTLLCAVCLSAQTTDGKVNECTEALFKLAPTPQAMARLDPEKDVLPIIRSVGLAPSKSRNLVAMARRICEPAVKEESPAKGQEDTEKQRPTRRKWKGNAEVKAERETNNVAKKKKGKERAAARVGGFGGTVPEGEADLVSLAGVGPKTAAVVRAQAFGVPSFPVDTHIHRCALRWGLTKRPDEKDPNRVSDDLKSLFPRRHWNKLHLQIIYMGREHCPAKNHRPSLCPICRWIDSAKKSPAAKSMASGGAVQGAATNSPKKHKGVVFYAERLEELAESPHLVAEQKTSPSFSSSSSSSSTMHRSDSKTGIAAERGRRNTKRKRRGLF